MSLLLGLLAGMVGLAGVLVGAGAVVKLVQFRSKAVPVLLAFAAGTLLGASLLGLIPESNERLAITTVTALMLAAVLGFFLLEKWVIWRHCHDVECEIHGTAGYLILVGDGVHNAVDGVVLGAAFVTDVRLGAAVAVAVLAHELPQEIGDFALLLESGLSRARALAYNLLSAAAIFPGVVAGWALTERVERAAAAALALAAGGFLYVALADLVPDLHRRGRVESLEYQIAPMLTGIALIWAVGLLEA